MYTRQNNNFFKTVLQTGERETDTILQSYNHMIKIIPEFL